MLRLRRGWESFVEQVVEDHPLVLNVVLTEVEEHLDTAMTMLATESVDPKIIATHQAIMHLLQLQQREVHHMLEHGLINHEEETELKHDIIAKKTELDRLDLASALIDGHSAKLELLREAVSLTDESDFAKRLAHLAILYSYSEGETLFSQGESSHRGCYIVLKGCVRIVMETDESRGTYVCCLPSFFRCRLWFYDTNFRWEYSPSSPLNPALYHVHCRADTCNRHANKDFKQIHLPAGLEERNKDACRRGLALLLWRQRSRPCRVSVPRHQLLDNENFTHECQLVVVSPLLVLWDLVCFLSV